MTDHYFMCSGCLLLIKLCVVFHKTNRLSYNSKKFIIFKQMFVMQFLILLFDMKLKLHYISSLGNDKVK